MTAIAEPRPVNLAQKIANARKLFKEIKKDVQGYDYKYADLDSIMTAIKDGLIDQGINIHHTFKPVDIFGAHFFEITCHVSDGNQELTSTVHMPWKEPPAVDKWGKPKTPNFLHEMGKIITYGRRYSLSAALCLTAEEDTDGQDTESKEPSNATKQTIARVDSAKASYPKTLADEKKTAVVRAQGIRQAQVNKEKTGLFNASEEANKWLDGVMTHYGLSLEKRELVASSVNGKTAQEIESMVKDMAVGEG